VSGALQFYLNDAASLLHDYNNLFTPQNQLVRWVNEARRQCAQRTYCVARLVSGQSAFGAPAQAGSFIAGGAVAGTLPDAVPIGSTGNPPAVTGAAVNSLQTIPGVERYPYQGFFNKYLQDAYGGCAAIIDVVSCSVNWGGAARPTLAFLAWDDLQAYARAYSTLVTSYPYYWSIFNPGEFGEVWLFPAPSTVGDIELYAACIPSDLYSDDDVEAIPPGYRNAIKFGAASLAFQGKQQYAQAEAMEERFKERLGLASVAADRGKTPNYYWRAY
jgi:hypothetical protein